MVLTYDTSKRSPVIPPNQPASLQPSMPSLFYININIISGRPTLPLCFSSKAMLPRGSMHIVGIHFDISVTCNRSQTQWKTCGEVYITRGCHFPQPIDLPFCAYSFLYQRCTQQRTPFHGYQTNFPATGLWPHRVTSPRIKLQQ